jgi:hypothetical protein
MCSRKLPGQAVAAILIETEFKLNPQVISTYQELFINLLNVVDEKMVLAAMQN